VEVSMRNNTDNNGCWGYFFGRPIASTTPVTTGQLRSGESQQVKKTAANASRHSTVVIAAMAGATLGLVLAAVVVPHVVLCIAAPMILTALKHTAAVSTFTWGMTALGGLIGGALGATCYDAPKQRMTSRR
jgi:hypothetical protein